MIYLDNAASTFPKPPEVIRAVTDCLTSVAGSPGRGSHEASLAAARIIADTRRDLAGLFNVGSPADIIFTSNATHALNLAIRGWVEPEDTVLTTLMEHNSVYRPLERMKKDGVVLVTAESKQDGAVDIDDWRRKISGRMSLAVINHASNVTGTIQPLAEMIDIAGAAGVPVLVDAAQTAGAVEIDIGALKPDMLAFTGHKALLGPQGTGGLYIRPGLEVRELTTGGTGTETKGPQPTGRPERYESGTYNTPGLAGLGAAVRYVNSISVGEIYKKEQERMARMIEGLKKIDGITVYGPDAGIERASLVSLTMRGIPPSELATILEKNYDIFSRAGWLCAPLAHRVIGTYGTGALRLSPGWFSDDSDIDAAVSALAEISRRQKAV